jgi:hypothetical protein
LNSVPGAWCLVKSGVRRQEEGAIIPEVFLKPGA